MTILNKEPIRGMARDFLDKKKKMKKAHWWYCLSGGDGQVHVIVNFEDGGRGTGGLCMLYDKKGNSKAAGYLLPLNEIKPFKNQLQKDLRWF